MAADSIPVPIDRTRQSPPYDEALPVMEARFTRAGHVARDPSWTLAAGPWPGECASNCVCSLLHFAEESAISLEGRPLAGEPADGGVGLSRGQVALTTTPLQD